MNTQTKYFTSRYNQIVQITANKLISSYQELVKYQEIVFIDPQVEDYQQLISGVIPGIKTIILDPERDSIDQISAALSIYTGISTIHLVSHGDPGCLYLGGTNLNQSTLGYYTEQLSSWFGYRESVNLLNPKILIYGCNVAAGDAGTQFITELASLTGADIAATAQPTGNKALGGNWELEVTTSDFEFALAFEPEVMANYESVLATFTVTNTNDSGEGSLRQAILDANANGEADVIAFNIPATELENDPDTGGQAVFIRLDSILPVVTETITIDGSTQTAFSGDTNPASTASGSESTGPEVVLDFSNIPPIFEDDTAALEISAPNSTIDSLGFTGIRSGLGGDNAVGIRFDGRNADGSVLRNSTAYENASHGIYVDGSFNVELRDNVSRDNVSDEHRTADGIHLTNTENITIVNNQVYRNGGSGIDLSERGTDPGSQPNINILIDGNILNGNGVGAGENEEAGVAIRSGNSVTISNNTISQNLGEGIYVRDENSQANINNTFSQNSIFANGRLGIDLGEGPSYGVGDGVTPNDPGDGDEGANNLLNFPEFTSFVLDGNTVTVEFDLDVPAGNYRLEFFTSSSGNGGEGETFVNFLNINHPGGSQSFSQTLEVNGEQFITATVTEITGAQTFGNTSEFSAALEVSLPDNFNPVANDDSYTVTQDTILSINASQGVILGTGADTDGDGDALVVDNPGTISTTANGTVTISSDGSFEYTPASGFTGSDSFTYTISDGQGGSDTATVTVEVNPPANNPPTAAQENGTTVEDTPIDFDVLANAADPDGDPLTIESVTDPSNGTVSVDNNGTPNNTSDDFLTYTPNSGFTGSDSFTYTISDGQGGSDTATVTVEVNPPANNPPTAAQENGTTVEDTPIDFDVLANAADPDGDPLTIDSVTDGTDGTVTIDDNGTPNNTSDDFLTYTPNSGFTGSDSFTYTIVDGQGGSDTATVTVDVVEPSQVVGDNTSTTPDTAVDIDVLGNDIGNLTITEITQPNDGTVTIDDNGTPNNTSDDFLTYTPNSGFTGTDSFGYTATDNLGNSGTATVTVSVEAQQPNAVDDTAISPLSPVTIDVLSNDTDPNQDILTVADVSDPNSGTVVINDDGTVTYTPNPGFIGTDSFTYTVSDEDGNTDTATVNVQVTNTNVLNDGDGGEPCVAHGVNDILTLGGGGNNIPLRFTLEEANAGVVNEVGVFLVDDTQGTIGGIAPGEEGYTEAALESATVIFSALEGTSELFDQNPTRIIDDFSSSDNLSFYLIQNSSTDAALADLDAGLPITDNIFFASNAANGDGLDHVDVDDLGNNSFAFHWEDTFGGGDLDFNDLSFTVATTNDEPPLGNTFQGESQQELIDLTSRTGEQVLTQFFIDSNSDFANLGGLYRVENASGAVLNSQGNLVNPGDEGYTEAALAASVVEFGESDGNVTTSLAGGFLYAPYVLADGETGYFPFVDGNGDGFDHLRLLADNTFGFEDTAGGGDSSFDDFTFEVYFPESDANLIDLTGEAGNVTVEISSNGDSAFANEGGLYQVENASGGVLDSQGNLLNPGDDGYAEAALAASVVQLGENENSTVDLAGGNLYASYILANGNTPYFSFTAANGDGINHVRRLGDNRFGFEDTTGGGDFSYDDFVIDVDLPGEDDFGSVTLTHDGDANCELVVNDDNNVFTIEGTGENQSLKFTLTGSDAGFVNEVVVFQVNADGGIGEGDLNPGDEGYLEAALESGTVVFSALSNNLTPLGGEASRIIDGFDGGDSLGFLFIQNSTADQVLDDLATGNDAAEVFFATTAANDAGLNAVEISTIGNSGYQLAWEDNPGVGDGDFNDFVFSVALTDEEAPLGNNLQGAEESEIIDLTDFTGEQVQLSLNLETNSQGNNTVGLYAISDASGTVVDSVSGESFAPGDEGYGSAVADAAIATLTEDGISSISLDGGELYAAYLTTGDGDVFVPFSQGNGDSVDHVRLLADNTFGFEDVLGGGDLDYNDAVLGVEVNVI